MWKKEFDSSYAGFTTDGAEWLVHHTNIKFVGKESSGIIRNHQHVCTHVLMILTSKLQILVETLSNKQGLS